MKHTYRFAFLFIVFLVGCTVNNEKQDVGGQSQTPVITTDMTNRTATRESDDVIITPSVEQPVSMPQLILESITSTILPTSTLTPQLTTTPSLFLDCVSPERTIVEHTYLTRGLAFMGIWDGLPGLGILGGEGFNTPAYFLPESKYGVYLTPKIAPNREWLVQEIYSSGTLAEAVLVNPDTNQEVRASLDASSLTNFSALEWLNNSQLIALSRNEEEMQSLFIFSPFTNEQEIWSTQLTKIAPFSLFSVPPVYDPFLKLVIYLCESCEERGYLVKDMESGETIWSIRLDPIPAYPVRGIPVWSPNGEYVAVSSGATLNRIEVFNRYGETVQEISFSETSVVTLGSLRWSPDSQYLSSIRRVEISQEVIVESLFFLPIHGDGSIIDLCVKPTMGPYWSPDGTAFAYTEQTQTNEQEQILTIVKATMDEAVQLPDSSGYVLIGWMKILGPGE